MPDEESKRCFGSTTSEIVSMPLVMPVSFQLALEIADHVSEKLIVLTELPLCQLGISLRGWSSVQVPESVHHYLSLE